jgi:regulatory protein
MLGRRELTRAELIERLVDRGYEKDAATSAVDALAADGSVDDRRTAFAHVRSASRIKGRGRLRIQRELEARGITKSLAREALEQISNDDDLNAVRRFLSRKRVSSSSSPSPAERRRLFQQLLRKGFPADLIAKVLREPDE